MAGAAATGADLSSPRHLERGRVAPLDLADIVTDLQGLVVADLDDEDLVDALARWEHVASAVAARQGEVIRELTARRPGREERYVPDEVACALTCTRRGGEAKVALAHTLGRFPALHDALLSGDLDTYRVNVTADELAGLPHPTATALLDELLPQAVGCTGPQLRRLVRRAALNADPTTTARRCAAARADRHVELTPSSDAMAWISALLPAPDALAVFTVIDALAGHHDAATGTDRTLDQRRADAFTDVFTTLLDSDTGPSGRPLPRRHGTRATVHVTVAATTLLGLDQTPGELAGYGPIPAPLARQIAADGTWLRILTDPTTGVAVERGTVRYRPGADLTGQVLARDVTCTFPGCRQPAARCDLDHVIPYDPTRPAAGQTVPENLHALCRHHHLAKTHTRWGVSRNPATGTTAWTSPAGITYARSPVPIDCTLRPHEPPPPRGDPRTNDPPPPF